LLVAPRDAGVVIELADDRRARRTRDDDRCPRRPRLVSRPRLRAREEPEIEPLELEPGSDDIDGQPGADAIICEHDQPPARPENPQHGAPQADGGPAGVPPFPP
jgi:hypothetical protein